MNHRKPNLIAYSMHRQIIATALTLIVVLVVLVLSVDRFMLGLAALNLSTSQQDQPSNYYRSGKLRNNCVTLDANGVVVISKIPDADQMKNPKPWASAADVIKLTQMHGVGELPWVNREVVWSAISDGSHVNVRWKRVDMARSDSRGVYLIVIVPVLCSGLISLAFATSGARKIAKSVNAVAQQSCQMADGHFEVHVAAQPTVELQQLADNLNDLATGLDQTIRELQDEHLRLKCLEISQRQFVADASHELRAPLSSLSITLSAWEEGMIRPDEQQQTVAKMHREVQRLARIVSSLLELGRIDAGHTQLDIVPVDIHQVAAATLAMLPDDGAPVVTEFTEPLPLVSGSVDGLQRILVNLLDNARRYTPAEGSIRVSAEQTDQMVAISVADTGSGIPDELLSHIWERFAHGEANRNRPDEGVGLGLSIVRGLAEAMGGSVSIQTRLGFGTTITVNIPVYENYLQNT